MSTCQSSIIFHLCLSWALIFREKKVNELSRKLYDSFSMLITNWTMTQQKKWSQSSYGSFYFLFRIFFLNGKKMGWVVESSINCLELFESLTERQFQFKLIIILNLKFSFNECASQQICTKLIHYDYDATLCFCA